MNYDLGDTQLILEECRSQGLSKTHTAYVLATAKWETAHTMKPVREAYWLSEEWRRKNLRYYPWYGRGYVQLTWKENYIKAGDKLGISLTADPDVVMRPNIAARILVRGMKEGWFRGNNKLSDYTRYEDMRDIINGDSSKIVDGERVDVIIANIAREYEKTLPDMKPERVSGDSVMQFIFELLMKLLRGK